MAKQPSMKAKIARMDKGQMGDDIGRIPNTIILPSAWEDYPAGLKMKAKLLWRKFSDTVVGMSTSVLLNSHLEPPILGLTRMPG